MRCATSPVPCPSPAVHNAQKLLARQLFNSISGVLWAVLLGALTRHTRLLLLHDMHNALPASSSLAWQTDSAVVDPEHVAASPAATPIDTPVETDDREEEAAMEAKFRAKKEQKRWEQAAAKEAKALAGREALAQAEQKAKAKAIVDEEARAAKEQLEKERKIREHKDRKFGLQQEEANRRETEKKGRARKEQQALKSQEDPRDAAVPGELDELELERLAFERAERAVRDEEARLDAMHFAQEEAVVCLTVHSFNPVAVPCTKLCYTATYFQLQGCNLASIYYNRIYCNTD